MFLNKECNGGVLYLYVFIIVGYYYFLSSLSGKKNAMLKNELNVYNIYQLLRNLVCSLLFVYYVCYGLPTYLIIWSVDDSIVIILNLIFHQTLQQTIF